MVGTFVFLVGCTLGFAVGFGIHEFGTNLFDRAFEDTGT